MRDRQSDRNTDRQTEIETERQIDRKRERHTKTIRDSGRETLGKVDKNRAREREERQLYSVQ